MLNFFHFKWMHDRFLLTNDFGRYAFVSADDFRALVSKRLSPESETYAMLKEQLFLLEPYPEFQLQTKPLMRDSKQYLFNPTCLHILVVTNCCNGACRYCQAQAPNAIKGNMSLETAQRAADLALSSPGEALTLEFQGGEPLLNFEAIRHCILYTQAHKGNKRIFYTLVSNLTLLTEEILAFLLEHGVSISTSIDGPESLHDQNRPLLGGGKSYRLTAERIGHIRALGGNINAIQTTTRMSLHCPQKIVDSYLELGFHSLFLRPLTPLGYAAENWDSIGYTPEEFLAFYHTAFSYILELNRSGVFFTENHAVIFLRKILGGFGENYMELRSPCGAALGQLAYYHDGNIYTCDEGRMLAEMGNDAFLLGNVYTDTYDSLLENPRCKAVCAASVTESLPSCCDCVYQPYCGVCPVVNLALEGDIFPRSPQGYRCRIYQGILDELFSVLKKGEPEDLDILKSWL